MFDPLYDEYAGRLYGYCHSLVGEAAGDAVYETFVTAARQGGPRGPLRSVGTELWLYGLARTACLQRDITAPAVGDDPLDRAFAALRPDQREALYLSVVDRLEDTEIAGLLGVAADTVGQLVRTGRTRLEHAVIDSLLPGPVTPDREALIRAFESGDLTDLFATRAPTGPPPDLREHVLASCQDELDHPPAETAPMERPARAKGTRRRAVLTGGIAVLGLALAGTIAGYATGNGIDILSSGHPDAPSAVPSAPSPAGSGSAPPSRTEQRGAAPSTSGRATPPDPADPPPQVPSQPGATNPATRPPDEASTRPTKRSAPAPTPQQPPTTAPATPGTPEPDPSVSTSR